MAVCADPIHPLNLWVGDKTSIRYVDTENDTVSLIAGSASDAHSYEPDGIGESARLYLVFSIICTRDGARLYATNYQYYGIRMVDLKTRAVTCVGDFSFHGVRKCIFDRCSRGKPESALYFTSNIGIYHLELATETVSRCPWHGGDDSMINAWGLSATPSGHLIFSRANTIHVFDPVSGEHQLIAGAATNGYGFADGPGLDARFGHPWDLVVVDHAQCVFVADNDNRRIRCITLPPSMFVAKQFAADQRSR